MTEHNSHSCEPFMIKYICCWVCGRSLVSFLAFAKIDAFGSLWQICQMGMNDDQQKSAKQCNEIPTESALSRKQRWTTDAVIATNGRSRKLQINVRAELYRRESRLIVSKLTPFIYIVTIGLFYRCHRTNFPYAPRHPKVRS